MPAERPRLVAAGVAGVGAPVAFVAATVAADLLTPGYDAGSQSISELFATGTDTATLVRAGMVGFALLAVPFLLALRDHPAGGLPGTAAALALDALGTFALVFFPCSLGCPGPGASTVDTLHFVVAGAAYAGHLAAPLVAAVELRGRPGVDWLRVSSLVLGVGALAIFLVWLVGWAGGVGGLAQRIFTIGVDLWIIGLAVAVALEGWRGRVEGPLSRSARRSGATAARRAPRR